jgi:FlaG/FlaF family flagellin (archaellin)
MMNARLLGFVIGVVLMVAIPVLAGAPVKFF